MLTPELKEWLDENAQHLISSYLEDAEFDSPTPSAWTIHPKAVNHYGGEDQGSSYWTIWRFNHADGQSVLIRVNGWYQSYHGHEYENWEEVVPVEKTVIEYERRK